VILIHKLLFTGPNIAENIGQMLFINFIGPEPKSLAKVLYVDVVIMVFQAILLQCKWDSTGLHVLSALPVPIGESLVADNPPDAEEVEEEEELQERDENATQNAPVT